MKSQMDLMRRLLLGYDNMFAQLTYPSMTINYPPHDVIKFSENHYAIHMAVAGFTRSDITIDVTKNLITVKGVKNSSEKEGEYIKQGIAARSFVLEFPRSEHLEIRSAILVDGILKIDLEYVLPESQQPRRIEII